MVEAGTAAGCGFGCATRCGVAGRERSSIYPESSRWSGADDSTIDHGHRRSFCMVVRADKGRLLAGE